MKRVLFVDQSQVLGGAELSLIDLSKQFPGCAVAVFSRGEFSDRLEELQIKMVDLDVAKGLKEVKRSGGRITEVAAIPALFSASVKLSRAAKDFDVIYANTQKAMLVAGIAGKLSGKPVIWHLRDLLTTDHFSNKLIRISVSAANHLVLKVIANSHATAASFIDAGGDPTRVSVIHNGVDSSAFTDLSTDESTRIRNDLGIGDAPVAGIFSRIAAWKGQHVMLEAASKLPDWHVLVVGDALFQNDQEYKDSLFRIVQKNGMDNRVHFLGFRNDVPALMAACDVVVHTSTSPEPFGRVIVEGMLARTPVIAAQGGGASEIVRHGENGFLFDPDNPIELRQLLYQVASDDTSGLLESAFAEAVDYYSVDRLVRDVRDVITSLNS
ncbi:MAG: glycosyltransferase family 4 protein [Rhodothermales bacterium]|nr:glycosyltransferase family 4 protein [Rhodothermales bacterium]